MSLYGTAVARWGCSRPKPWQSWKLDSWTMKFIEVKFQAEAKIALSLSSFSFRGFLWISVFLILLVDICRILGASLASLQIPEFCIPKNGTDALAGASGAL